MAYLTWARRCAFAIIDMASCKWIDTTVSVEETSTQVKLIFDRALLVDLITPEHLDLPDDGPSVRDVRAADLRKSHCGSG